MLPVEGLVVSIRSVLVSPEASAYPSRLLELPDPPLRLEIEGSSLPAGPTVGIVGSRRPSPEGLQFARELGASLAAAGVGIISGGALGIDAAAHRGALDGGGKTWAVLVRLHPPGPPRHRGLFRQMVTGGGGLLAEPDKAPHAGAFLARNRLVAALSDVLVVVQARARSGTSSTVAAARRLGRKVGAVPWGPYEPAGAGCREILEDSGFWVGSSRDVLDELGLAGVPAPAEPPDPVVAEILRVGRVSPEDLAASLGRPLREVLQALARLEIEGRVRLGGGEVRAVEPLRGPASRPGRPR